MNKWLLVLGSWFLVLSSVGGCHTAPPAKVDPDLAIDTVKDPEARFFDGHIISLRFNTATMLVGHGKTLADVNVVEFHWDRQSRFYLDGNPTDLTEIRQYMPVQIKAHMHGEQCVIDTAKFSSQLPPNVHPATQTAVQ